MKPAPVLIEAETLEDIPYTYAVNMERTTKLVIEHKGLQDWVREVLQTYQPPNFWGYLKKILTPNGKAKD